jgi:hypothetical protein
VLQKGITRQNIRAEDDRSQFAIPLNFDGFMTYARNSAQNHEGDETLP